MKHRGTKENEASKLLKSLSIECYNLIVSRKQDLECGARHCSGKALRISVVIPAGLCLRDKGKWDVEKPPYNQGDFPIILSACKEETCSLLASNLGRETMAMEAAHPQSVKLPGVGTEAEQVLSVPLGHWGWYQPCGVPSQPSGTYDTRMDWALLLWVADSLHLVDVCKRPTCSDIWA
jgi:hypothetical protein